MDYWLEQDLVTANDDLSCIIVLTSAVLKETSLLQIFYIMSSILLERDIITNTMLTAENIQPICCP